MRTLVSSLAVHSQVIYLISDIHSNLPALEAVLKEIPGEVTIVCAGDIVGYYLEPNEVCDLLKDRSVLCIKGNHDKYVLGELNYPDSRESKYRIIKTRRTLTSINLKWLESLPDKILLEQIGGQTNESNCSSILIAHGTPSSAEEYVYPDTSIDFLIEKKPSFLVLGHTHHPMIRQAGARIIVNPGSVGQVRDRVPGASYARIDLSSQQTTFYRVSYDLEMYQQRLEIAGVESSMIKILSRSN